MEQTTFAKKTVVLAALGALSLMSATARADGTETPSDPQPKNIEVTVGSEGVLGIASEIKNDETSVTWNDEWLKKEDVLGENESFGGLTVKENTNVNTITVTEKGSLTIDLPTQEAPDEEAAKVVTFDSVNLSVEDGGTFKNSSHLKFTGGSFKVSVESADSVANFENTGEIYLHQSSSMEVGSGSTPFTSSDEKLALNVGDVTIGSGATLTNKDKGYQVTKEADGESRGEGAEPGEDQTLVHFGTVTVDGGQFINAEDARSEGTALVIESVSTDKEAADIKGTSVWGTLQLSQKIDGEKGLSDYVAIEKGADFRVTEALVIDSFDEQGSFKLDGETDAEFFADGIDISAGSHVATDSLTQDPDGAGLDWKNSTGPAVGTLKITGYAATFTPADTTEGEDQEKTGDEDTNGSWTYKKFGDVTVVNTKLEITGARPKEKDGTDPYDGHGYTPSLHMESLTLGGTSMKIAYDVDVEEQAEAIKKAVQAAWDEVKGESTETIEWTEDNLLEQIESMLEGGKYSGLQEALEGNAANLKTSWRVSSTRLWTLNRRFPGATSPSARSRSRATRSMTTPP